MQALAAGHQLKPTEEKIESVGEVWPRRIGMRVERALDARIARDEKKVGIVFGARPFAEPALVRRGQIEFALQILASCGGNHSLGIGEMYGRNRLWQFGERELELLKCFLERSSRLREHPANHGCEQFHDGCVIDNEAHFGIERNIFVEMTGRVVRLGPEDGSNLKNTLQNADHDLL